MWLYSDESCFRNTTGFWAQEKNPTIPKSTKKRIIWGVIRNEGKTKICILSQIDHVKYTNILKEYLIKSTVNLYPRGNFTYYSDNAPPRSKVR